MSARWIIAGALALFASPAAAQDASELADRFERALVAGDYRVLPLTEDFTYTENGAPLDSWDGMWRTTKALEGAQDFPELDYRVELVDGDTVVRIVESIENTVHGVMAYRLVARDGQIASVHVLPVREEFGGDRGGTITLLQPMLATTMDGELVAAADPALEGPGSNDADAMESAILRYFRHPGATNAPILFSEDCVRVDNGHLVTDVQEAPVLDPGHPGFRPFSLSCEEQFASNFYSNLELGSELNEHAVVSDPARGIAVVFARLDQSGTILSFTTPDGTEITYPGPRGAVEGADTGEQFDGRILTNMITPMSVNGVYLFKFDPDGAIERIDAFYRGAPLGWDAVPD